MFERPWTQENPPGYTPTSSSDPIHLKNDGWYYFWDEIWVEEHGPFASYDECVEALKNYCEVNCLT